MKVLVLVDDLSRAGGLERSLSLKVPCWLDRGHEVTIVTHARHAPDFFRMDPRARRLELPVHYRAGYLYSPANLKAAARHLWHLCRTLRAGRPDVVVHCGYGWDFYLLPLVAPRGTLLIKENHSSRFPFGGHPAAFLGRLGRAFRRRVEQRYDVNVFLSKEEAAMSRLGNATVIPNMADPAIADTAISAEHRKQIIAAGRICHVKGFDRLVRAWALAAPKLPGWRLLIMGDGTAADVAALHELVASLALERCTELRPASPAIQSDIAQSSIYALASRSECFPMVLLEAMQLGTPIVAFDCPTGPRNILIDHRTGLLVPDGDLVTFADAIVRLASNPDLARQLAANAKAQVAELAPRRIEKLWNQVLARAAR